MALCTSLLDLPSAAYDPLVEHLDDFDVWILMRCVRKADSAFSHYARGVLGITRYHLCETPMPDWVVADMFGDTVSEWHRSPLGKEYEWVFKERMLVIERRDSLRVCGLLTHTMHAFAIAVVYMHAAVHTDSERRDICTRNDLIPFKTEGEVRRLYEHYGVPLPRTWEDWPRERRATCFHELYVVWIKLRRKEFDGCFECLRRLRHARIDLRAEETLRMMLSTYSPRFWEMAGALFRSTFLEHDAAVRRRRDWL